MTSKIPVSDNNFSIDKIISGELKNPKIRTQHIETAYQNAERLLRQDYVVNPPTLPAAHRKIRIVSNNAGDTGDMLITYVDASGDEGTVTLTLNGTTNVQSSAVAVFINNVESVNNDIVGTLTVTLDLAGNDFASGSYIYGVWDGGWKSSYFLVLNDKRIMINYFTHSNPVTNHVYWLRFKKIDKWLDGATRVDLLLKRCIANGNAREELNIIDSPLFFDSGSMVYITLHTSNLSTGENNIQYVQFDK